MKVTPIILLVMATTCASSGPNVVPVTPDRLARLSMVQKLYVDRLGEDDGSALVREKIRARLVSSGAFQIVERIEDADAVLTGFAGVETRQYEGSSNYRGVGLVRVVDVKSHETIWSYEYKRGFMLAGSVSSRVADQIADQILKAAGKK